MRAVIYCRISQDRGGAGVGVDRQEYECRQLAERLGWTVVEVLIDNDISAFRKRRRPGYLDLLDRIRSGDIQGVIAWHPDRLHRSPTELEDYISASEQHGVATQTVKAGLIDLSNSTGRMQARIAGAVARQASEQQGERVASAWAQRAREGRWGGGLRPFGFEADGVTVRPSEAAEIVTATHAVLAGSGLRAVVRDFNERGVLSTTGGLWSSQMMRQMLKRPRNAGLSSVHGDVVGQLPGKPILDEDTWKAVVALLSDPRRRTSPGAQVRWLGSGLYVCGVCGNPWLRVSTSGSRRPAYRCASRDKLPRQTGHVVRDAGHLDGFVSELIVRRLSAPGAVDLLQVDETVDTGALHQEASVLQQRLSDLAAAFADGEITRAQLGTGSERLNERLAAVDTQLAAAATVDPLARLVQTPDVQATWDAADIGVRRAVLDALMVVTVLPIGAKRPGGGPRFDPAGVDVAWKR